MSERSPGTGIGELPEGWTPVLVYFEDDGRTREVLRSCRRCFYSRWPSPKMTAGRDGPVPLTPMLVSPQGIAHMTTSGDTTDCGKDCTRTEWWFRL